MRFVYLTNPICRPSGAPPPRRRPARANWACSYSDNLPLNVSIETLQQHELLKVIKNKLVRKTLDMIKKISDDKYDAFGKEYLTVTIRT
jgi:hypothetical protein